MTRATPRRRVDLRSGGRDPRPEREDGGNADRDASTTGRLLTDDLLLPGEIPGIYGRGAVLDDLLTRLAARITAECPIPTIGIGASAACDGQILVLEDMLGLSERVPKFVKKFGSLRAHIEEAVSAYADEVRSGSFPGPDQVYGPSKR